MNAYWVLEPALNQITRALSPVRGNENPKCFIARNVRNRLQKIPLLAPLGPQLGLQNRPKIVLRPRDLPVIKRHQVCRPHFLLENFRADCTFERTKIDDGQFA